jgi:hypothetical protein
MGTELQMLLCIGGIYTSYLAYGLLQEGIYKFEDSSGRKCVTAMPLQFTSSLWNHER